MEGNSSGRLRVLGTGLGCLAAVIAFFASAEVSHQFLGGNPAPRRTGEILAVVVLISLATALSWVSPLAGASACITIIVLILVGMFVWDPRYWEIDPMGLDPKEIVAFGSQQMTSAALLPALLVPGLLRHWSLHARVDPRGPDTERTLVGRDPSVR